MSPEFTVGALQPLNNAHASSENQRLAELVSIVLGLNRQRAAQFQNCAIPSGPCNFNRSMPCDCTNQKSPPALVYLKSRSVSSAMRVLLCLKVPCRGNSREKVVDFADYHFAGLRHSKVPQDTFDLVAFASICRRNSSGPDNWKFCGEMISVNSRRADPPA